MIITAILAKNEATRYLPQVLIRCKTFSDKICLLDDRSTDDTARVARDAGALVRTRSVLKDAAWGTEAPARAELWDWAVQEAGDGWVLICDADMILQGDIRALTQSWDVNAWAFILYDLWDETHFRHDGFWQGHLHPRVWMVRPSTFGPEFRPQWPKRGIHTGHIPENAPLQVAVAPPETYHWLHYSYASPEDRTRKAQQYHTVEDQLTEFERAHASSILA